MRERARAREDSELDNKFGLLLVTSHPLYKSLVLTLQSTVGQNPSTQGWIGLVSVSLKYTSQE